MPTWYPKHSWKYTDPNLWTTAEVTSLDWEKLYAQQQQQAAAAAKAYAKQLAQWHAHYLHTVEDFQAPSAPPPADGHHYTKAEKVAYYGQLYGMMPHTLAAALKKQASATMLDEKNWWQVPGPDGALVGGPPQPPAPDHQAQIWDLLLGD